MKKGFLVLLIIIFLLPFLAIAHTTYIIGGEEDRTKIWGGLVNVTIREGHAIGEVSGDISGTVRIYNDFSLKINDGEFAGYEFGFREWGIYGDSDTYIGISTWFYDPESDETHIAIGGDIAAIGLGHSIGDRMVAKFDIARIGDTQHYGSFIYEETGEFTYYNRYVHMDFETALIYAYGSGYYNGEIFGRLFDFEFRDPFTHEVLIDPQVIDFACYWGNGAGFSIALLPPTEYWWLGGMSSPLYGVIGDIVGDGKSTLIEHAAVPLPSTFYLLGSGLFGILVIRKKRKKRS